jgi:hypothetical protein
LATIYDPFADNDKGLLTRHLLRHLIAAQNRAAKNPAQEKPLNMVSLPGKRKAISTSPMVNNTSHLLAVYSEALLAASVDMAIKGRVIIK